MANNTEYAKSVSRSSPSPHKPHYSQYVDAKEPDFFDWSEYDPNAVALALSFSEDEISNLVIRLQNPLTGVKVTDCKWRSRKYSQCFSGQEGVKWLLENSKVSTIEEAEALGQRLLHCGALRSLSNSPLPFQNNPYLYQLKGRKEMRDMDFMDELIKEYLLYRGLMETFTSFEKEIKQDKQAHQFEGSRIVAQLYSYINDHNLHSLLELWKYIDFTLFSKLDQKYFHTVEKLELGIKRYYIVHAVQSNRMDKVNEFFRVCGDQISGNPKWAKWFHIPFVKNASKLAEFEVYFSKQWADNLSQSLTNFISTVLHQCTLPKILLYSTEKLIRKSLEAEIEDLKTQLERAKRSNSNGEMEKKKGNVPKPESKLTINSSNISPSDIDRKSVDLLDSPKPVILGNQRKSLSAQTVEDSSPSLPSLSLSSPPSSKFLNFLNTTELASFNGVAQSVFRPNAAVLRCCKFSNRGSCIAIGSAEGAVEVWQADDSNQIKARIFCFSDILSLAWQTNEDRILLCGTANGKIKVWDTVQAVMVADIKVHLSYSKITSISFSPTSSSFICSVCSIELLQSIILLFDLETMKIISEISPETNYHIFCVKYNATSTKIACGGSNGYISIYDIATSNWNTWKGHEADVMSVVFHKSSAYLLSIGKDGKLLQWSYSSSEKPVLQYCYDHLSNVDVEIAFSSSNEYFIVNSGHVALIYRFNEPKPIHRIDGNRSMMVDVDWHPFYDDVCLTATSDSHVQITKLIPKPSNPYVFSH